jgi:hypothetical protein
MVNAFAIVRLGLKGNSPEGRFLFFSAPNSGADQNLPM